MQILNTDVLIAGGGTAGVCAAIQAARAGVAVILVAETPWLGGMLTAAGVSCTDGNQQLPAGLWGEFRQQLYAHYGGPDAVDTGWVSHTNFEPHTGHRIFQCWIRQFHNISTQHGFYFKSIQKQDNRVTGARFENRAGQQLSVKADITIDATEQGDLLAAAGCAYRTGVDPRWETQEKEAPEKAADILQDITYVATLKDYGKGAHRTIPEPPDYDPDQYLGCCQEHSLDSQAVRVSALKMLNYGRLPYKKYMLNWPIKGNDFYLDVLTQKPIQRERFYQAAKNFTLGFVYLIQTKLGFSHLGLAEDEFPTADRLPFYPYFRESRRLKGVVTLTVNDLLAPYDSEQRAVYKTGIAVGDYPLDHHHAKAPQKITETFPPIPSYTVPYGCLVPQHIQGLLVTEKSISVTHLVNGTTRLQPVVMQIGQAGGAAAALCVKQKIQPAEVPVRILQQKLLDNRCYLLPFAELTPADWAFQSVQRIGASGVMQGQGKPHDWANQTLFYPEKQVTLENFNRILSSVNRKNQGVGLSDDQSITRQTALVTLYQKIHPTETSSASPENSKPNKELTERVWQFFNRQPWFNRLSDTGFFTLSQELTRQELAYLIDHIFDPFNAEPVQIKRKT